MDAYVEVKSKSSNQLVLHAWLVPAGLLGEFENFFGLLVATIEANTTVFGIDADLITEENPVLAHKYHSGSVFFDYPALYVTLEKDFHLYYWEWLGFQFPLNHVPGKENFSFYTQWFYKDTPPEYPEYYLYPYNQKDVDAGEGYVYKASSFPQSPQGLDLNLVRWFTDAAPPLYRHVIKGNSVWLHYLHGHATFEDYTAEETPEKDDYRMYSENIPPALPSYTGTNMSHWEDISQDFADNIDISTDNQTYYFLDYVAGQNLTWRSVLQGKQPQPFPSISPFINTQILTTLVPQVKNILSPTWVKRKPIKVGAPITLAPVGSSNQPLGSGGQPVGAILL